MHLVGLLATDLEIGKHARERTVTGLRIVLILALKALRLVDEQHACVLKDDLGQGQRLLLLPGGDHRLGPEHADLLPRVHAHVAADARAVDAHIPLSDRLPDRPERHVGRRLHEQLREHQSVLFPGHQHLHGFSSFLLGHCMAASLHSIHLGVLKYMLDSAPRMLGDT